MAEKSRNLTVFEAACVVAGLGFGGGVMAVPYLASRSGWMELVITALVAYAFTVLMHLMVVEIMLRGEKPVQLIELIGSYIFRKNDAWWGKALTWLAFLLVIVSFYAVLAGYLIGCSQLMRNIFPALPLWACVIITYIVAGGIVLMGLKAVGISEKISIIVIAVVLVVLSIISFFFPFNSFPAWTGDSAKILALFGMVMFCMTSLFAVPQAAEGLMWNKKKVAPAVVLGITINLVFTLMVSIMAALVSKPVTEVAIVGWGNAIGFWALVLGSTFGFLGLLTSYWSVAYAIAIVVVERVKWDFRISWLIATLPSFLIAIFGLMGFLSSMRLAGGAMAAMMGLMIPPAFLICRKQTANITPEFSLGKWWGSLFMCILVFLSFMLMMVGSAIPVK